tara:strand:- start:331 stop:612 length:282 start_codon:yes stop_codon:yes gene_type:complete
MPQSKKISPPWAEETVTPNKKGSTKKKSTKLTMSIHTSGEIVELSFDSKRALEVAKVTISERCSRGSVARVTASGKEYAFIPNLGFLVTNSSD